MKRSKRYKKARELYDKKQSYTLDKAIEILKKLPGANFDETVEIHLNMGVDPRKADQQIRNSLVLPNGTGKTKTVLVFAEGEDAEKAKEAGADYVGVDEYVEKINNGWLDFDVAISTPKLMRKIGRLGRILGPRGLMPSPKVGTVTNDVEKAVKESKGGKITYRIDKFANLHIPTGKISFEPEKLKENILSVISAILKERPPSVKGIYIKSLSITSTMRPSIKLNIADTSAQAKK